MIRALILFFLLGLTKGYSQNIPLGEWESHFGYRSAKHVLKAGNKIFCSSYNGLFSINPADNNTIIYSKADGLNDVGVSSMAYDSTEKLLILAYRNGNLDLLYLNDNGEPDQIINWPFLLAPSDLPESKRINKIVFHDKKTYIGTSFGIIVLDPTLLEVTETYRYIGTNGAEVQVSDLTFSKDSLYAATSQGLLGTSLHSAVNRQYFANWKTIQTPHKIIAASFQNEVLYAGFPGKGIFKRNNNTWSVVFSSSSPNISFSKDLATLSNNIVVLNKDKADVYENPLFTVLTESLYYKSFFWTSDSGQGLLSNKDGDFKSYRPFEGDTTISVKIDSSITDLNGYIWTRLPTNLGGGISVRNIQNNQQRILSVAPGNGGLPSQNINSLSIDEDGYIWFASDRGVGYFIADELFNGSRLDAILPLYGQRKLFSNERCNAIAIEPGNRKWIGTDKGLFQFTSDGTELIKEFKTENSPLPSNQIKKLFFEPTKGNLFADTPNGMISYRSDASAAQNNMSSISIFPNPVRPDFEGNMGVTGLMDDTTVKITDLSGRLVYETHSQGGTASWNLSDYTGKRVRSGVYLIILVSSDRSEKMAGKLAIIN